MKKLTNKEKCSLAIKMNDYYLRKMTVTMGLLVDAGATSHIIREAKKFKNYDQTFQSENHYIKLTS